MTSCARSGQSILGTVAKNTLAQAPGHPQPRRRSRPSAFEGDAMPVNVSAQGFGRRFGTESVTLSPALRALKQAVRWNMIPRNPAARAVLKEDGLTG
jgi:hypothetical protein